MTTFFFLLHNCVVQRGYQFQLLLANDEYLGKILVPNDFFFFFFIISNMFSVNMQFIENKFDFYRLSVNIALSYLQFIAVGKLVIKK